MKNGHKFLVFCFLLLGCVASRKKVLILGFSQLKQPYMVVDTIFFAPSYLYSIPPKPEQYKKIITERVRKNGADAACYKGTLFLSGSEPETAYVVKYHETAPMDYSQLPSDNLEKIVVGLADQRVKTNTGDISKYSRIVTRFDTTIQVEYQLKDPHTKGGGGKIEINKRDLKIVREEYEQ